jgi:hypothetical protein
VVVVVPVAPVVPVVEAAPPGEELEVDGSNVASNGERKGVGSTTGTPSSANEAAVVPNCTLTMPLAWISCVAPAWSVPAHNVEPVVAVVADTQHGPVVLTVNL